MANEDRKAVPRAATNWVVQDGIPFSKIEGERFKNLADQIARVAQKYKNPINIKLSLPTKNLRIKSCIFRL